MTYNFARAVRNAERLSGESGFQEVSSYHDLSSPYRSEVAEALIRASPRLFCSMPKSIDVERIPEKIRRGEDLLYSHPEISQLSIFFNLNRVFQTMERILMINEGEIQGMRVLDLGCGSPFKGDYFSHDWPPFHAEILHELGAHVVGIDYRENSRAGYEHRVYNFKDLEASVDDKTPVQLRGEFDLVIATKFVFGLSAELNFSHAIPTLLRLLGRSLKPEQVQYLDDFTDAKIERDLEDLGIEVLVHKSSMLIGVKR